MNHIFECLTCMPEHPSDLLHEPVTVMFTEYVRPDRIEDFEQWSAGVHSDARQSSGFISVDVIRPTSGDVFEYTTLMKFDSYENLKRWSDSASLAHWMEQLPALLIVKTQPQSSVGMQLWFDRPGTPHPLIKPPFWKSSVVGVISVYPLVVLLNWGLAPVTQAFPEKIALLVNVIVLSALLTYPVMPWVTRLLRGWLFPHSGS